MSNHQYYQECEKIWTTCPECHPTVPDATGFSSDPDAEIPATRWGEGAEL